MLARVFSVFVPVRLRGQARGYSKNPQFVFLNPAAMKTAQRRPHISQPGRPAGGQAGGALPTHQLPRLTGFAVVILCDKDGPFNLPGLLGERGRPLHPPPSAR